MIQTNTRRSHTSRLSLQGKVSRTCGVLAASLLLVLGIGYITVTTTVAARGFEIKSLNQKLETLRKDTNKLDIAAAEKQSITQVEYKDKFNNFAVVTRVEYLNANPEHGVAVR